MTTIKRLGVGFANGNILVKVIIKIGMVNTIRSLMNIKIFYHKGRNLRPESIVDIPDFQVAHHKRMADIRPHPIDTLA